MREKGEIVETALSKKNIDYDRVIISFIQYKNRIIQDLELWKQGNHEKFDWSFIEKITKNHGISIVLNCFSDAVIDAIGRPDDVDNAYTYFKTIVAYYSKNLYTDDKADLINYTLNILEILNDYSLDNHYLLDLWGKIISLLIIYKLFSYKDLDKLSNLNDDQIDCIFLVVCKSVIESGDKTIIENELLKLSFFKFSKKILLDKLDKLSGK